MEPIPGTLLQLAKQLKVISRNGTGVENIDNSAADSLGITVTRTVGANSRGVAELAFALMLAAFRHVPWSHSALRTGRWERRIGIEAQGRTLGIVGCGAVGRQVAQMGLAFQMKVIGHDPIAPLEFDNGSMNFAELNEVLSQSDAVTLHCPPTGLPILDSARIACLRNGATVVNTARAGLVDDTAMLDALNSGRVACYATDVYQSEPPHLSRLLKHERVILMPHAGGFTRESVDRAAEGAVDNLISFLETK